MTIDILTLFTEACEGALNYSIIGRAMNEGKVEIACTNFRDFTTNRQRQVDDYPYGGGRGLVLTVQPINDCYAHICERRDTKPHLIYMSPKGKTLTQKRVKELAKLDNIAILCGHYEGVDQRLIDQIVDEEISIGDFVVTGGEMPALLLTDAIVRLLPGVLSDDECFENDSFYNNLLEHPHYTRPEEWQGQKVPQVLLSGHHANVEKWRREQSLKITNERRKDLFESANLTEDDINYLKSLD